MKIGITYRLFLAILTAALLSVLSMFLIMQWNIDRGFLHYVNNMEQRRLTLLAGLLERKYSARGDWGFLRDEPDQWRRLVRETWPEEASPFPNGPQEGKGGFPPGNGAPLPPPLPRGPLPGQGFPPPDRPGSPALLHSFNMRVFILDAGRKPLAGPAEIPRNSELRPLHNGGLVIGYLGLLPLERISDVQQVHFLQQQKLELGLVGGVVLLLAAGLSLLLANRLVRPVRALAAATDRLTAGEFATRVNVYSADEIGQLARNFNELARTLEKNEQARRQWVADTSHELRTPLTILRGEIEALQDGICLPTPESIDSLHNEVMRLERLVNDLYQLSLSDLGAMTYHKGALDLAGLLDAALAQFSPEFAVKGIKVTDGIPRKEKVTVFGDAERLRQLFANLFENSLKYTDPDGEFIIRLMRGKRAVTVDFDDSKPGVPAETLERLFDRLYRVETSRNRSAGGAGLGLAICRNIVEAHDGTIKACASSLGGIRITITLPLAEEF